MNVARKLIEYELHIKENGKVYCGNISISETSLARATNVERKTITATVNMKDEELFKVFSSRIPAGNLVKISAKDLGFGVVKIEAK